MNTEITFTSVTQENISQYKKLRKIYAKYKILTLRNHGESPSGKKMFYNLFDSIISRVADSDSDFFILMHSGKELLGFALISTTATDIIDIPYNYGTVNDFYIFPKHRLKGYGRILNNYIERIFTDNGTQPVLLFPDPVFGIPFWKAVGYRDTGINQAWGHFLVYCKHLSENENTEKIDNAISALVTQFDLIGINPYNKPQLKEVYSVWTEYCKENKLKPHKKDVKNMAWNARKNKNISFRALYYQGKIIGFIYNADKETKYILSGYENLLFGKDDDK